MKYIMAIMAVHLFMCGYAQNCSTELLLAKAGSYKESSGSIQGIATADLARQKKTVAAINSMIRSKYSPMGVEAHVSGSYNRALPHLPVNSYTYSIIPLNFYCDGNLMKTAHETSTYFQIGINLFSAAEIYDTAEGGRLLAEGFNVLPQMPVEKDGYFYFKEKDAALGFGMTGKESGWLITYNKQLPYAYVSKKEFLEKRKQILSGIMSTEAAGIQDVLKNNEIEKGYREKEYKNDPDKLQHYMKMSYLSTKERYEKQLKEIKTKFKPAFDKIESMLGLSATELCQPAIVRNDPHDHLSYLFTTAEDPFGKILVKPNPSYFNTKLPRSSPQFFSVYAKYNHKDPIAVAAINDLVKAVDFAALKNMVGK